MKFLLFFLISLDYSLNSKVGFFYDNNIFKYSTSELKEYRSGCYPYKYPIKSADDLIFRFEMGLTLFPLRSTLGESMSFQILSANFLSNKFRSFWRFNAGLRKRFKGLRIDLAYSYTPYYLVRYLKPKSLNSYELCFFSRHKFEVNIDGRHNKNSIETGLGFWKDLYNVPFNYYNSSNYSVSLSWSRSLDKFLNLSVDMQFINSDAEGRVPDVSYYEWHFGVRNALRVPIKRVSSLAFSYEFSKRVYKTENSPYVDPYHALREDDLFKIGILTKVRLYLRTYADLSFAYQWRRAHSPYKLDLTELKNYKKMVIGVTFVYRLE